MKFLIVVPDRDLSQNMYCLEQAIELAFLGETVFLLDLANLSLNTHPLKIKDYLIKLTHRNRIHNEVPKIAKKFGFNLIILDKSLMLPINDYSSGDLENTFARALASKFAYITGGRNTQESELPLKIASAERQTFNSAYWAVRNSLISLAIDQVITVNGRFVIDSATVLAAKDSEIPVRLLEVGSQIKSNFHLYSISPHNIPERWLLQDSAWEVAGENAVAMAEAGLNLKMQSLRPGGGSWKENFTRDFNISNGPMLKLAVFFPNSDVEFPVFQDFNGPSSFNGDQTEAFLSFCSLAFKEGYRVAVRVHPPGVNGKRSAELDDSLWASLCEKSGAQMFASNSGIDSYDLMNKSDLNVTYCSSIGIESILLGHPTLILGQTDYSHYVPECCAFSLPEIEVKLKNPLIIPERSKLYPWGYWFAFGGMDPKHFYVDQDGKLFLGDLQFDQLRLWYKIPHALKKRIVSILK